MNVTKRATKDIYWEAREYTRKPIQWGESKGKEKHLFKKQKAKESKGKEKHFIRKQKEYKTFDEECKKTKNRIKWNEGHKVKERKLMRKSKKQRKTFYEVKEA